MCISVWRHILVVGLLLALGPSYARAQSDSQRLIETIVARWSERQQAIRSIRVRAKVDSFYSKGYGSEKCRIWDFGPIPPDDVWLRDGTQSWAVDFAAGRLRKEFHKALISATGTNRAKIPPRLTRLHELALFAGTTYTLVIRPEEWDWPGKPKEFRQHVSFDNGPGHAFVIWPEDLPVLWCAGGTITGDWPNPRKLLKIDSRDQFVLYGRSQWQGRSCLLLRVRNQQSRNSVAEFWVDESPPHAIYRSQIIRFVADSERVERQIDVDYKEHRGQLVPSKWQLSYFYFFDYSKPPRVHSEILTVEDVEINTPLDPQLFTVRLEPGMGVVDGDKNLKFVVDINGKLIPYQNPEQQQRIASLAKGRQTVQKVVSVVVGVTVAIALSTAGWFVYRRLVRRKVGVVEQ
ncbi:MAG: hypothetical protein KatS3mg109_2352 [Pirellulaceae bacterium]|nr:MAG: hypothetical protein KatS3mg109_2352 [Pirellulaceae bacterium]